MSMLHTNEVVIKIKYWKSIQSIWENDTFPHLSASERIVIFVLH